MGLNKPMAELSEPDLQDLIDQKEAEKKTIDYKGWLGLGDEGKKKEFRADVSSFANALGGHLIYGMKETGGVPYEICGMDIADMERFIAQMESVIQYKITPRIPGYEIQPVPLASGKKVVVIRIPQSFMKPHQIAGEKEDYGFYARNSTGKYCLVVDELRSVFLQSETLNERIRSFRQQHLANIVARDTPVPMVEGPKVVYHLIPANAFSTQKRYEFTSLTRGLQEAEGVFKFGLNHRYNLDGIVYHNLGDYMQPTESWNYAQIFRNGIIEGVDGYGLNGDPTKIRGYAYDARIIRDIRGLLANCKQLGINLPLYVMVSLVGARGFTISTGDLGTHVSDFRPIQQDVLQLPDIQIDGYDVPVEAALRPVLDSLWNAAGWERSQSYDVNGVWTGDPNERPH